ncbi:FAD/NAD(P)-binding domain-containing protein [Apiospora phragmitis]|uniref:FAD/NAD(P)-binding domain-containing protein n=1 Tax=Apiospora phragmitis TaxID=2905665 RepID=A0ABR1UZK5_9PEZI
MTNESPWCATTEEAQDGKGGSVANMTASARKIKVAVVGTGMAGLATGYLLQHDELQRYSVTLFEKGDRISLDAASVTLMDEHDGTCSRVDLPMRAFAAGSTET